MIAVHRKRRIQGLLIQLEASSTRRQFLLSELASAKAGARKETLLKQYDAATREESAASQALTRLQEQDAAAAEGAAELATQ